MGCMNSKDEGDNLKLYLVEDEPLKSEKVNGSEKPPVKGDISGQESTREKLRVVKKPPGPSKQVNGLASLKKIQPAPQTKSPYYMYCYACGGETFKAHPDDHSPEHLTIGERTWHMKCFKCGTCGEELQRRTQCKMNKRGVPFHVDCFPDEDRERCALCSGFFEADFTRALGRAWHDECFTCNECKIYLLGNRVYERDNKLWCGTHYDRNFVNKCHSCKVPIEGDDKIEGMGYPYHKQCFVCSKCQKQFGEKDEEEGKLQEFYEKPLCLDCLPKDVTCDFCHTVVPNTQDYVWINDYGIPFCIEHNVLLESCIGCGIEIVRNFYESEEGKDEKKDKQVRKDNGILRICPHCAQEPLVETQEDLEEAWKTVTQHIQVDLDIKIVTTANIPRRLVEFDEIRKAMKAAGDEIHQDRLSWTNISKGEILIRKGMPFAAVRAAIAHEIAHCYIVLNDFHPGLEPQINEGIAEAFVHLWFHSFVGQNEIPWIYYMNKIRESDDPVFGQGYQDCVAAVESGGKTFKKVLEYVHENYCFPIPEEQPEGKPEEKPGEKPEKVLEDKPSDNLDDQPSDKPEDKPGIRTVDKRKGKPEGKLEDKPMDKLGKNPQEKPQEKPKEQLQEKLKEKIQGTPKEKIQGKPKEKTQEKSKEKPQDKAKDKPKESKRG